MRPRKKAAIKNPISRGFGGTAGARHERRDYDFVVADTRPCGGKEIVRKRHEADAGKTTRIIFGGKRIKRKRL